MLVYSGCQANMKVGLAMPFNLSPADFLERNVGGVTSGCGLKCGCDLQLIASSWLVVAIVTFKHS